MNFLIIQKLYGTLRDYVKKTWNIFLSQFEILRENIVQAEITLRCSYNWERRAYGKLINYTLSFFIFHVEMTSHAFVNFANEYTRKKARLQTVATRRGEQTADYGFFRATCFQTLGKLILQEDRPSGLSPRGIIRSYKNSFLWEISFSFMCSSREHLFATFPPIHVRERILVVIGLGLPFPF